MQLLSFHIVFEFFLILKILLEKNKLHILIELEILYHPVYLSIFLHRFIEKKFEYSEHTQFTNMKNRYFSLFFKM
jgi:hypothetical protein